MKNPGPLGSSEPGAAKLKVARRRQREPKTATSAGLDKDAGPGRATGLHCVKAPFNCCPLPKVPEYEA